MSEYEGVLRLPEDESGVRVHLDLEGERILIRAGDMVIGDWNLGDVRITATDAGFRLRVEGEEVVLAVDRDAELAIELGLRSAPPLLRRRMAALLRER